MRGSNIMETGQINPEVVKTTPARPGVIKIKFSIGHDGHVRAFRWATMARRWIRMTFHEAQQAIESGEAEKVEG